MKHSLYFLIIITLLFAGCRQKAQSNFQSESSAQTEKSNPSLEEYAEEAVITGKVLNRDFYPQEKELTLIIPFSEIWEISIVRPYKRWFILFPLSGLCQIKGGFYPQLCRTSLYPPGRQHTCRNRLQRSFSS